MKIETGVMHTQTKSCKLCIHIGTIAAYIGKGRKDNKQGIYLRILTPYNVLKLSL